MFPPDDALIKLREGWLQAAMDLLRAHMQQCGVPTACNCRVSCGFPLRLPGLAAEYIRGQYFPPDLTMDKRPQIFISPLVDDSIEVESILLHEMIHAAGKSGHRAEFSQAAYRVGLRKPWVSTQTSVALRQVLERNIEALGPYPHSAIVNLSTLNQREKTNDSQKNKRPKIKQYPHECGCIPVITVLVPRENFWATCKLCGQSFHRVI